MPCVRVHPPYERSRSMSSSSPFSCAVDIGASPPANGSAPACRSIRASGTERTNAAVPSGVTCVNDAEETRSRSAPCSIRIRTASSCCPKTAKCRAVKPSSETSFAQRGLLSRSDRRRSIRPNAAASKIASSESGRSSERARSASPAYRASSASLNRRSVTITPRLTGQPQGTFLNTCPGRAAVARGRAQARLARIRG